MTRRIRFILLLAIFIGGYASLSLELIVLRQLSGFVGSTAITTSIIIGIFLAFMSWGYWRGSELPLSQNSVRQTTAHDFATVALMVVLASSYILLDMYFGFMSALGIKSNVLKTFIYSLAFLSGGPYLFGKITALISRCLNRYNRNCTGKIMAIDTIGSVLGSILTTLVIMPFIGVNHTIIVVVAAAVAASVILADLWFGYVRYVQDNFIETLPKDAKKDILILGAGGFTMGEGDTFHNYTFLDIDKSLLKISEEKFLEHKLDANKKFVVEDANQFLKDSEQKYDLIVLDTYSSMGIIPMDLITKEYFIRVKNNLKKGGIVVMNILTSPNFSNAFAINLDNTIRSVFTHSLSRQVIGNFNAWGHQRANVIYVYYDVADKGGIYTADKNAVFYDM